MVQGSKLSVKDVPVLDLIPYAAEISAKCCRNINGSVCVGGVQVEGVIIIIIVLNDP